MSQDEYAKRFEDFDPDPIEALRAWNPRPHRVTAALDEIDRLRAELELVREERLMPPTSPDEPD